MPSKNTEPRKAKRVRGPRELKQKSDEFYSRIGVAQKIGCGPSTVAELERLGKLTPYKFSSRMVRYARSEVDALIEGARGGK
jgi:hypothetical protein